MKAIVPYVYDPTYSLLRQFRHDRKEQNSPDLAGCLQPRLAPYCFEPPSLFSHSRLFQPLAPSYESFCVTNAIITRQFIQGRSRSNHQEVQFRLVLVSLHLNPFGLFSEHSMFEAAGSVQTLSIKGRIPLLALDSFLIPSKQIVRPTRRRFSTHPLTSILTRKFTSISIHTQHPYLA